MNRPVIFSILITALLVSPYPKIKAVTAEPSMLLVQSVWQPFSSSRGNFTVLMPGKPTEAQQTINTQAGAIKLLRFQTVRKGEAGYIVGYADLPNNVINTPADINNFFSGVTASMLAQSKGKLLSRRNIKLRTYPGREIKLQVSPGVTTRSRFYLVNQRFYMMSVVTAKEQNLAKSIDGFFNSFRLLKNPSGTANVPKENLNASLKKAVCAQNWPQAIRVVNRMIAVSPSPGVRTQLVAYRQQLQGLARSRVPIPANELSGCSARP